VPKEAYERETLLAALQEIGTDGGNIDLASLGLDFGGQPDVGNDEAKPKVSARPRRFRKWILRSTTSSTRVGRPFGPPHVFLSVKKLFILAVAIVRRLLAGARARGRVWCVRSPGFEAALDRLRRGLGGLPGGRVRKPGIVAATSGTAVPAQLRQAGAQTVYWHMKLGALVGTTTPRPTPSTITASVDKLFANAVASSGCEDAVHRAERAERRVDDDAVDGDELALPPEHPRRPARAPGQGRAAVPPRQLVPVYGR
jgi:hypothetical protein